MAGFFDWLGSAAAAFIPGAAPFVAAAHVVAPGLFSGGAPTPSRPFEDTVTTTPSQLSIPPPPPPPLSPREIRGVGGLGETSGFVGAGAADIPMDETPDLPMLDGGGGLDVSMLLPLGTAVTVLKHALPEIGAVVPRWILRAAGGAALAAAIYEEYRRLRSMGHRHKHARRFALLRHGVHMRRRRMRVTNVHALRRAIRRVHGFRRICSKVGALHVGRRRLLPMRQRYRRHYRRGDVDPFMVEEMAEMADEAEDMGYEPDQFQEVYE